MVADQKMTTISHDVKGEGGTETLAPMVRQAIQPQNKAQLLPHNLMEAICDIKNLREAFKRVHKNKGSPGPDGMTTEALGLWLKENVASLQASLLSGTYRPAPVRQVEIPKPGGGIRKLGIPNALDRLVQQALLQVLDPIIDPTFSPSSFGFRRGRSAHQAVRQAAEHVREGYEIVVDIDLAQFFDRVNHDVLMNRLKRHIQDKRVISLIRLYLKAGIMVSGVCVARHEGTPQGGPLSPLLANILLDDLDKELERRGHRFCRYADDCNIYVRSLAAGERLMGSVKSFLEKRLRLQVNEAKSAVAMTKERSFLGFTLSAYGDILIARKSELVFKAKIRSLTKRNCGKSLASVVAKLNPLLRGWTHYFSIAKCRTRLIAYDKWIRSRLRCLRLKQCKRIFTTIRFFMQCGLSKQQAVKGRTSKGWYRQAQLPMAKKAMNLDWFKSLGLISMVEIYVR